MIIMDLEWNRGYDNKPLDEILQIGAVRLERLGSPILDTFNVYIRPKVHKRFGPGAKELPDLDQSLSSEHDFPEALAAFLSWCGEETEFAAWGGDDFRSLKRSCDFFGLPAPKLPKVLDLQRAFGYQVGAAAQQIALWRAVDYCGIPDTFSFHNALYDSVYTAAVAERLTAEALAYQPEKARRKPRPPRLDFSPLPFPPPPRFRVGPYPKPEDILNARAVRHPACPLCGKKFWVQQWYGPLGQQQYYAPFHCPEHGRFLCRLTLSEQTDGTWKGREAIPALTPAAVAEYQSAAGQPPYQCKAGPRRRRHRRAKAAAD